MSAVRTSATSGVVDILEDLTVGILEDLTDDQLHAVIARAQAVLLDRPGSRQSPGGLTIEIVDQQESVLLSTFRTLAPLYQDHLVRQARRLIERGRASQHVHAFGRSPSPATFSSP
jgi:hypothetical protein